MWTLAARLEGNMNEGRVVRRGVPSGPSAEQTCAARRAAVRRAVFNPFATPTALPCAVALARAGAEPGAVATIRDAPEAAHDIAAIVRDAATHEGTQQRARNVRVPNRCQRSC